MKKMQCEVCGSNDIKKIDDNIFECQSCGMQYDKAEVQKLLVEITGAVKIDHAADISNALQRAEQFLSAGDIRKATEYYNRVLDLDPNNTIALEAISKINEVTNAQVENERRSQAAHSSKVKVLKHSISPKEGISCFINALRSAPEITPDIYKEIEIMSVTQHYFPFTAVKKQYSGTYEGVACYRKMIPYTDYKTETDYHNKNQDGTYKTKQVAVTKYREEIERKNANGTFVFDQFGVFSVSKTFGQTFTEIAPNQYDTAIDNDRYQDNVLHAFMQRNLFNAAILKQIEHHIGINFNSLKSSFTDISTSESHNINGIAILNNDRDSDWTNRIGVVFKKEARSQAERTAANLMPGDFQEECHCTWTEKISNEETFYVPIQVVEYAYRGKFYYSAMLLHSGNSIFCTYPCITEVKAAETEAEKAILTAKQKPFSPFLIVLYGVGIISLISAFWNGVVKGDDFGGQFWLWSGLIPLIPAIIWNVVWKTKKKIALKQQLAEGSSVVEKVQNDYILEFKKECEVFFTAFSESNSISEASKAVKRISSYSADLSKIKGRIFEAKAFHSNASTESAQRNINTELDANCTYSLVLVKCGTNKMEVCKLMRELFGIGLASASAIADNGHSLVKSGISAEMAQTAATQFQIAGAIVEIQKDK